jgi:hypothetical protein
MTYSTVPPPAGTILPIAELQRRLAASQFEAYDAQVKAAEAAEETAKYTRSTARWMFWSVVAIAITSGIQALFAFLNWYAEVN